MSRKRKPVQMPIAEATEAVVWRAKWLVEALAEGEWLPVKRMKEALEDYAASKNPKPPFELPFEEIQS